MKDILASGTVWTRRMSRRDLIRWSLAAGAGGLLLQGCASPPESPSATRPVEGAATVSPTARPTPAIASPDAVAVLAVSRSLVDGEKNPWYMHSSLMCWEPLIGLNDYLEPVPVLAEGWELSADGLTWTFHLRTGVAFTDGTPFTADVVVKNVERDFKISPRSSSFFTMDAKAVFGDLAEVKKVDDHTVVFRHNKPFPVMEATLANFPSAMFSPGSFAASGDFAGIPATTGPFRLVDWQRDQTARLLRNDGYWGAKARVKEIVVREIPDANTRLAALEAGQVDAIVELWALQPAQAEQLRADQRFVVRADPISIAQFLFFNCGRPPFDNPRLRQAFAYAIDREAVVKNIYFGYGNPNTGLLSSISRRWFSPKGVVPYDPARAASLAQQELRGQRVEVALPFDGSPGNARSYKEMVEYLQSVVRPLGFDLRLQAVEAAALTDIQSHGEWNLAVQNGYGWANGDPDWRMRAMLYSKGSINITKKMGYHNDEVDRLIDQGVLERDESKRFAIYEQLQEISATEVPVIAIYDELSPYAYSKSISNLRERVTYQPSLELMEKK